MAKGEAREWPDPEWLREQVEAHGVPATARAIQRDKNSLRDFLVRNNLPTRKIPDRVKIKPVKVDDPERVKADQREAELKALRKENQEYADKLASRQDFLEQVAEECKRPVKVPKLVLKATPKNLPVRTVVTPIFDVQYGQLVIPEDTPHGRGQYSTAIFDQRLKRWYEAVTGSLRDYATSHRITEMIVPLGGDFVEGHGIFPGQEWQLEVDPFQQTWQFACKFGGDIEKIGALQSLVRFAREEINGAMRIRFYAVPGNHGKPQGRKAGALHSTHSFDWLTAMLLRDKLRGEPIDEFIIEPAGALYFETAGSVFLMIHGDEIRGWGGIPFYGLAKYESKAIRSGHILHDYLLMGDKHVPAEIEQGGGGETLMSGAWVGENNLSRALGAAARPQQRIYYVAEKWGISESVRIYFQDAKVARAPAQIHGRAA